MLSCILTHHTGDEGVCAFREGSVENMGQRVLGGGGSVCKDK